MSIHPTAIVDPKAEISGSADVGPYAWIGPEVRIEDDVQVGSNARIEGRTRIGEGTRIFPGACIGLEPQDLSYEGERTGVRIGARNVLREYCTIHRATGEAEDTFIGDDNYIMAYAHIAHNCRIGSNVIIANATQLAGHIQVHDHAFVSGLVAIHQFVRLGAHSFVGGGTRVPQDLPPFFMAVGIPSAVTGVNLVGLRRRGFDTRRIRLIQEAYRILYRTDLTTTQALERLKNDLDQTDDVRLLIEFVETSERGIIKKV
jgi:UDP-N-acetylglucosamine acyltransferase